MKILCRYSVSLFALGYFSIGAFAGAVQGTITFQGEVPEMPVIDMDVDPVCATHHSEPVRAEALVLGEGLTMANVLVQITEGRPTAAHPAPTEPVVLTQQGCQYSPHVFVVRKGQALKVLNPDGTLHNIHGLAKVNPEFNKTMIKSITEISIDLPKTEAPFMLKCQVHPWMTAYCAVLDHPFYAVTGTDGRFEIGDLPPGDYTVEAWHERLGKQTAQIKISGADETATQDFTFERKKR